MDGAELLRERLLNKRVRISPPDLQYHWDCTTLTLELEKPASYESGIWFPRNLRSAFLDALYECRGDYGEGLAKGVAPFAFFRSPDISIRGKQVTPPFVIAIDDLGDQIKVILRLFGLARLWRDDIFMTLVAAFQTGVRQSQFGQVKGAFALKDFYWAQSSCWAAPPAKPYVALRTITPLQHLVGRKTASFTGHALAGLVDRLNAIALWMGFELWLDDGKAFFDPIRNVHIEAGADVCLQGYDFRRKGRDVLQDDQKGFMGQFRLSNIPETLWPLLWLGQQSHMGDNAVKGFGRYELIRV